MPNIRHAVTLDNVTLKVLTSSERERVFLLIGSAQTSLSVFFKRTRRVFIIANFGF